jgi:TetR/AcrR family tetracycline transcriptional repressor
VSTGQPARLRYRRTDVVERALVVLDQYGLPDLSMRRLATELGVQPSALYHHFASKQALLAAVADEILDRGRRPAQAEAWDARLLEVCHGLRDSMLAYRDGAEVIATAHAFGLGERDPQDALADALGAGGFDAVFAHQAAATLLHFVLGHVSDEQLHLQANSVGAIDSSPLRETGTASFDLGLSLITDGIRQRHQLACNGRPSS